MLHSYPMPSLTQALALPSRACRWSSPTLTFQVRPLPSYGVPSPGPHVRHGYCSTARLPSPS